MKAKTIVAEEAERDAEPVVEPLLSGPPRCPQPPRCRFRAGRHSLRRIGSDAAPERADQGGEFPAKPITDVPQLSPTNPRRAAEKERPRAPAGAVRLSCAGDG